MCTEEIRNESGILISMFSDCCLLNSIYKYTDKGFNVLDMVKQFLNTFFLKFIHLSCYAMIH